MATNTGFTIGWISALPLEREAARLVLDEEYPQEDIHYQTTYYLGGRIGQHNVVIGVQRKIGLSGAALLAEKMRAGFPNIKYFVLVGIAGGVPRYGPTGVATEIVLGGVVVARGVTMAGYRVRARNARSRVTPDRDKTAQYSTR